MGAGLGWCVLGVIDQYCCNAFQVRGAEGKNNKVEDASYVGYQAICILLLEGFTNPARLYCT